LIKISVKGLAKFITATEQGKRKVLRDFKYPDPEGAAQAMYYREARDLIEAHHRNGYPSPWLQDRATTLTQLAQTMSGQSVVRLRHNARALREYAALWGNKTFEVLDELRLSLRYGNVRISVVPDLHVRERDGGKASSSISPPRSLTGGSRESSARRYSKPSGRVI
jgi:hypothetical protein